MNIINSEICSSPVMFSLQLRHHNVDISVAVSTDSGLITPIVFDAAQKVTDFLSIRHNFHWYKLGFPIWLLMLGFFKLDCVGVGLMF